MASRRSLLDGSCVVVGGRGAVGGMFVDLLLGAGGSVCVVDTLAPPAGGGLPYEFEHGDISAIDPRLAAALGRAEMVVLAVPEDVALTALQGVVACLPPGALLVDTLSVKSPITAAIRAHAVGVEAVGLNPMFAPSLGIEGRPVAAVVVHDGPRARELLDLVGQWGGRVVELGADEHDALTAATQALTHATVLAFGLGLADLGVDIADLRELATPPHTTLLALLARIASGAPETYWDVQAANAHAVGARSALADGLRRLADVVEHGDPDAFDAILDELRGVLGHDLDHYREICQQIFDGRDPDRPARAGATP